MRIIGEMTVGAEVRERKRMRWEERNRCRNRNRAETQRCEDAPLLTFRIEEGATNQGMQNAGSVLKLGRQKNSFSLRIDDLV